jgi:hypothetical protein
MAAWAWWAQPGQMIATQLGINSDPRSAASCNFSPCAAPTDTVAIVGMGESVQSDEPAQCDGVDPAERNAPLI